MIFDRFSRQKSRFFGQNLELWNTVKSRKTFWDFHLNKVLTKKFSFFINESSEKKGRMWVNLMKILWQMASLWIRKQKRKQTSRVGPGYGVTTKDSSFQIRKRKEAFIKERATRYAISSPSLFAQPRFSGSWPPGKVNSWWQNEQSRFPFATL